MTAARTKGLGFWALLALVVGNMIGSGIYLLPASLAPLGWNQMIGWLISITGAMALGYVFARLGAKIPLSGGPYAYANAAFGPLPGFMTAWSYWVMSWVGNGAIAVAVVSALDHIFPRIGQTAGLPAVLAVACVWLVTWVNIRGVRAAGRLQEVTVVLKLLPLVLLIGLALWLWLSGAPRAPDPGIAITGNSVANAVALTFWGFLGLEAGTVPADKVEDAARNVPRATLIGVLLTGAIYLLISGAFALYVPVSAATGSPAPIADFLGLHFGPALANMVALCAAISAFGTLNGWVLVQAEMPWAMARGGVFPAWFGVEGPHGTPVRSHLVSSSLLTLVTLLNYQKGTAELFAFIASVSLAAGLLTYLMSALAALRLQPGDRLLALAAVIACGFTVWAEYGLGLEAIAWGTLLIGAGLPVYWAVRSARSSG
ncbi:amino acid permease [Novosphingobium sp. B 225]|uniref:amino acid permease n=1 Tax=Novosphingobium sp. B 225 TaxID=1961849 RepID=UPI000B4BD886|nr:amino acid permease [Novosphingobium sp. B 225]